MTAGFLLGCQISLLKMHPFRGISPVCVLTPQKETGCHIFKMTIFSKFFGDVMTYKIRENAGKRIEKILVFVQLET